MKSMKNIIFLKSICLISIIHSAWAMDTASPLAITSGRVAGSQESQRKSRYINPLFKACAEKKWDEAKKLIKTEETSLLLQTNNARKTPLYFIALWNVGQDAQKKQQKRELLQEYCARFGNNAHTLFEHVSCSFGLTLWDDIAYNGCPIATEAAIIALLLKAHDKSFMIHKTGWLIKKTPLHTMVLKNNLEAAQMLLNAAGDDAIILINEPDSCGSSPLNEAFFISRIDMLHLFAPYVAQDWAVWLKKQIAKLAYFE